MGFPILSRCRGPESTDSLGSGVSELYFPPTLKRLLNVPGGSFPVPGVLLRTTRSISRTAGILYQVFFFLDDGICFLVPSKIKFIQIKIWKSSHFGKTCSYSETPAYHYQFNINFDGTSLENFAAAKYKFIQKRIWKCRSFLKSVTVQI